MQRFGSRTQHHRHAVPMRTQAAPVLAAALLTIGLVACPRPAFADAPPVLQTGPFDYAVVDQDLRETLTDFGRNLGLLVEMSDSVHGRVRNMPASPSAGAFLERLAAAHDLVWYLDGSALHVATAGEVTSKVLPLKGVGPGRLRQAMAAVGASDPRLALAPDPAAGLVSVTGPPDYVALVAQTIDALGTEPVATVSVIRGIPH